MPIINFFADPGSYTPGYYATVLDAATAVATPFLVQQQNQVIPGATVSENQITYNGNVFTVSTNYINPGNGYYIQTPEAFANVWPTDRFPNAAYDGMSASFNATIDCVGF